MAAYYVVSDLHMGDKTARDQFLKNVKEFSQFLDFVKGKGTLVIAGDLLELWQCDLGKILKSYPVIFRKMFELRPIVIPGNHDYDLNNFAALEFDFFPFQLKTDGYLIEEHGVFVEHGNRYDQWNDPNRNMELAKFMTFAVGYMEEHDANVEAKLGTLWDRFSSLSRFFRSPDGLRTPSQIEQLDLDPYVKGARDTVKNSQGAVKSVVFGHTHKFFRTRDDTIFNAGSWVTDEPTYVLITEAGERELRAWPSNTSIENRLFD